MAEWGLLLFVLVVAIGGHFVAKRDKLLGFLLIVLSLVVFVGGSEMILAIWPY